MGAYLCCSSKLCSIARERLWSRLSCLESSTIRNIRLLVLRKQPIQWISVVPAQVGIFQRRQQSEDNLQYQARPWSSVQHIEANILKFNDKTFYEGTVVSDIAKNQQRRFDTKYCIGLQDLEAKLYYINQWHCQVQCSKVIYVEKRIAADGSVEYVSRDRKAFEEILSECGDVPPVEACSVVVHMDQMARHRRYERQTIKVYSPLQKPEEDKDTLNMFGGFLHHNSYDPLLQVDQDTIKPILDHLLNVWCNGQQDAYEYLLSWFAKIAQTPDEKPGTAIIVKSDFQGTGKGIVFDFLSKYVFGQNYCGTITDIDNLWRQFNNDLKDKILVLCDEVDNNGSAIHNSGKMKALITNSRQRIEQKGIDAYYADSYTNFIFNSNHDYIVKVEFSDRRFLCLSANLGYAGSGHKDYFINLAKSIMNPTAGFHFYMFLLQRDISQVRFTDIPMTEYKQYLIGKCKPPKFTQNLIDAGIRASTHKDMYTKGLPLSLFYDVAQCKTKIEKTNLKGKLEQMFGMEAKRYRDGTKTEDGWPGLTVEQFEKVCQDKFNIKTFTFKDASDNEFLSIEQEEEDFEIVSKKRK